MLISLTDEAITMDNVELKALSVFIYRRPTLYPVEIAVDFLKSL
jgi:hypothetical protein